MSVSFEHLVRHAGLGDRLLRRLLHAVVVGAFLLWHTGQCAHAQFTRFQNYTDEQGLGNLTVTALAQDPDGYILLGTEGGLYRFDGSSIAAYDATVGLPSAAWIRQVTTDGAGRLWVVTTDGVFVRYGSTFSRIDAGRKSLDFESSHLLAVSGTSVVLDVAGTVLSAPVDSHGVGRFAPLFDASMLAGVPGLAAAHFVVRDPLGGLLIGCGVAICRANGGRVTVFGAADGLPADAWQVALRTQDGTLWARSLDHLAWRRPGQAAFAVATVPGQNSSFLAGSPEALDLIGDRKGGVLTQGDVGLIDWNGAVWRSYAHHAGGLSANRIQAFLFDREGSLWVGSFGTGAFRSVGFGDWEHWTADDGLPSDTVWSMTRLPDGQFWVATDNGSAPLGSKLMGVAGGNYMVAASHAGRLWIAPFGKPLVRLDRARGVMERFPSIGVVRAATVDRDDRLWLGTRTALYEVADADAPASSTRIEVALPHEMWQVTADASGVVWLVSHNGIFRRNAAGRFDLIGPADLLKAAPIDLAFAPNGDLWIATDCNGVLRARLVAGRLEMLPSIAAPVIGSNNIVFVHRDSRGWMWLGTDHGIDMFDGRSWRRFDSSTGPISNDMDSSGVFDDVDGSIWFGTSHGLSHLLDPAHLPPPVTLHPMVTGLSLGDHILPLLPSVRADWSPGPLVVRYVDLDYAQSRSVSFRYRLRGVDDSWNDTTAHEVRYAGLPSGKLRFELIAVDAVHGSMSAAIGFTVHIRAPWWRRWWFYGLCLLAGAATFVGAWQARVRLLLRQRKRLEEVVSKRTVEIEQAKGELKRLAMSDALTGVPNRRAIMLALEEAVAAALPLRAKLAVLLCDIDHFKKINDCFGHLAGDAVLAAFGSRLASAITLPEAAGRYGGEEFLVILPGAEDAVVRRVAAIHTAIAEAPYAVCDLTRTVTSSGGLAFLRETDTALTLVARADAALYRAKERGRNRIEQARSEVTAMTSEADGTQSPRLCFDGEPPYDRTLFEQECSSSGIWSETCVQP